MPLHDHYPPLSLNIGGRSLQGEGRQLLPVIDPATGATLGELPLATPADLDLALEAAQRAFAVWRGVTPLERGRLLQAIGALIRERAPALARIVTLEQGKGLREALHEIQNTADTFEWMAEEGKRAYGRIVPSRLPATDQHVRLEPIGPVAAFSPWNFPAVLACRKVATALAAGCPVIIKPAEETPGIMLAIARLCEEAGLPPGVLNVVYGEPAEVSTRLIASDVIRKVSFTGSVPVGRLLATQAAQHLKKITLELGGHSPVVITGDVDLEQVLRLTLAAKFRNAGQLCLCPTRFFVHESVYEAFANGLAEGAAALRVGNGLDDAVQMGPLANARRRDAMAAFCDDARQRGARLLTGGKVPRGQEAGYFWSPTILADMPDGARSMTEEVFGPLALVRPFSDLDEAIAAANATDYGLAAYAFTRSLEAAHRLEHGLQAGNVSLNTYAISAPEMPFSGIKHSGLGHEMGTEGLYEHMNVKAVVRAVG